MKRNLLGLVTLLLLLTTGSALALPSYDQFGQFDAYTGNGSGIPNHAVATTSYQLADPTRVFTLGLTATPRYDNPAVNNDGAGTFSAFGGTKDGLAKWNFGFYLAIDSGYDNWTQVVQAAEAFGAELVFDLYYDVDPGAGTDYGVFHIGKVISDFHDDAAVKAAIGLGDNVYQGSQNLLFDWLYAGSPYVDAPAGSFAAGVKGLYNFKLESWTAFPVNPFMNDIHNGTVSIDVNVVPEPGTLLLLGAGVAGLFVYRRKS